MLALLGLLHVTKSSSTGFLAVGPGLLIEAAHKEITAGVESVWRGAVSLGRCATGVNAGFVANLRGREALAEQIAELVWNEFPGSIRVLLDNQFVFQDFWSFHNGTLAEEEWKKRSAARLPEPTTLEKSMSARLG